MHNVPAACTVRERYAIAAVVRGVRSAARRETMIARPPRHRARLCCRISCKAAVPRMEQPLFARQSVALQAKPVQSTPIQRLAASIRRDCFRARRFRTSMPRVRGVAAMTEYWRWRCVLLSARWRAGKDCRRAFGRYCGKRDDSVQQGRACCTPAQAIVRLWYQQPVV